MAESGQRGFEDLECYQLALQVLREAYRTCVSNSKDVRNMVTACSAKTLLPI
jgi:hypothetical protein